MISADIESLKARVIDWQNKITIESNIIEGQSTIGGGSLPGQILPTYLLSISGLKIDCGVNEFFNKLLNNKFPIVARIEKNNIIFDPRTVLGDEDSKLIDGINSVYANI